MRIGVKWRDGNNNLAGSSKLALPGLPWKVWPKLWLVLRLCGCHANCQGNTGREITCSWARSKFAEDSTGRVAAVEKLTAQLSDLVHWRLRWGWYFQAVTGFSQQGHAGCRRSRRHFVETRFPCEGLSRLWRSPKYGHTSGNYNCCYVALFYSIVFWCLLTISFLAI